MGVSEGDTDLRRSRALFGELAYLLDDGVGRDFEPGWRCAGVGEGAGGDAFAVAVHATHDGGIVGCVEADVVEVEESWR